MLEPLFVSSQKGERSRPCDFWTERVQLPLWSAKTHGSQQDNTPHFGFVGSCGGSYVDI